MLPDALDPRRPRDWDRDVGRRDPHGIERPRLAGRAGRRRGHADAATAEHERPLEDRCLLEPRREAGARLERGLRYRFARRIQRPRGFDGDGGRGRVGRRSDDRSLEDGDRGPAGRHRGPRHRRRRSRRSRRLRAVDRLARLPGHRQDGREQEERQAGGQEQVADRRDVVEWWDGEGDQVGERTQPEQELGAERWGKGDVEHGTERLGQSGRLVGGQPDGHVPAVDHDHEGVAGDADEGERHARVAAVLPQREQQHPVGEAEQRQTQLGDDVDAVHDGRLGREPEDDAGEQQRQEPEADVGQPLDLPAEEQAEQEPDGDAGDQHRGILG